MRTIPAGFRDTSVTDLQVCWEVNRRDGAIIRGTEADIDITVTDDSRGLAGIYLKETGITGSDVRSTDDLAVDNLEIKGALGVPPGDSSSDSSGLLLTDLAGDDIEAGLYDNAEITTFLVNSKDPDLYQHVLRTGWMGNIRRDSDQRYTTEMRGLTQALSQQVLKTYGVGCHWELGDSRCKVDMAPFTFPQTVTGVTSRREFDISTPFGVLLHLVPGGTVTWTSGANEGFSMEIKAYISLNMELYLPMPNDIDVGDTLIVRLGCNKSRETCIQDYNNVLNFGGWGVFVPGQNEVLKRGQR